MGRDKGNTGMGRKATADEKAAERLQRLLNIDFDVKEFEVAITYENSVKNGSENRQQYRRKTGVIQ